MHFYYSFFLLTLECAHKSDNSNINNGPPNCKTLSTYYMDALKTGMHEGSMPQIKLFRKKDKTSK